MLPNAQNITLLRTTSCSADASRLWSQDNPAADNGHQLPEDTWHNWVMANKRMASALRAKGYDFQHTLCEEAGHVDGRVVVQTMAPALEWLWEGYGG